MSKKQFQVGDRVAVYGYDDVANLHAGARGTVLTHSQSFDIAVVRLDNAAKPSPIEVSARSCVRLVKKSKRTWPNCPYCQFPMGEEGTK